MPRTDTTGTSIQASTGIDLSRKIVSNTLYNFVGRSWAMVVGILLMPYIVSKLGVERFGVWALVFSMVGYLPLLDLGTGTASVKYIAQYHTQRDEEAIAGIVNTTLILHILLGVVAVTLMAAGSNAILTALRIPADMYAEARFTLLAGAVILSARNMFSVFEAVTKGLQRMDLTNIVAITASVLDAGGTVLFLELGYGLAGLIYKEAIVAAATAVLFVVFASRLLPTLTIDIALFDRTRLRQLVRYGSRVQISQLADVASSQVDKIVLSHYIGLRAVAYYELGAKVIYTGKRLSRVITSAIMPAASEIQGHQDRERLRELYYRGSKYLISVAAPLFFFIAFGAPLVVRTWLGSGYERTTMVIQLLALAHFVHLSTAVGTMIAQGIGKPEYETRYTVLLLIMNIVLSVTMVMVFGFIGVLVGAAVSLTVSSSYFIVILHRGLDIPLGPFLRKTYMYPVLASLAAGLALIAVNYADPATAKPVLGPPSGGIDRLIPLALGAGAFGLTYLIGLFGSGYVDAYDRQLMLRIGQSILGSLNRGDGYHRL